jgi:osmotically-inducible protein OsmY
MWNRTLIALLVASTSCLWGADTHAAAVHQREAPAKAAAAKAPARSDAQLEADIRARFARSKINADKFQVHVQGGVATLEGRTDVIQHKGTATRMAKSAGAAAVNNRIQISDAAREKAAGNLAEGRRRAQIKRSEARSATPQPRQTR